MPQMQASSVENNFTGGLKTEFTGLNFPENACTDADNVVFTLIGDVIRREGIDLELNHTNTTLTRTDLAISTFKWENVGGDGSTRVFVAQVGTNLHFWRYSAATTTSPISAQKLATVIDMTPFVTGGATTFECQYAEGNGYLFVFHPLMDPFYCTFDTSSLAISATRIVIQIRDFLGISEPGLPVNTRPSTMSEVHNYNLYNQGWTSAPSWIANSTTVEFATTGAKAFTIAAGLPIIGGQQIQVIDNSRYPSAIAVLNGTVTSYIGTTLTVNISSVTTAGTPPFNNWVIFPLNAGFITTWNSVEGNYPSNADVWWRFKNTSEVFDPATTAPNVTLNTGNARRGHYILNVFNQSRTSASGIPNLTNITTVVRPRTGTWFQGRVWYSGVDASVVASGNAPFYTWTEDVYFSQTIVDNLQFGNCFQTNDPTSEDFFDLLPTDGGVIKIQGCGGIQKLFPIQNGLLVFASNGIWFITGSQGIGFAANDYTVTKISSIRALTGTSFVNVQGLPFFWNEEGIYTVQPAQQGGGRNDLFTVQDIVLGTIASFYAGIPLSSKTYARGDYDPLNYIISWVYRDTEASSVTQRYEFNKQLSLNTSSKAFYTYTVEATNPVLHDIKYIYGISGAAAPAPAFKYLTSTGGAMTFSEEYDDTNWVDFHSVNSTDYTSYFVTGYKLHGKALVKWQPQYLNFFSRADRATAYKIQGIWDYANDPNSGKYSAIQMITNGMSRFGMIYRKHKIRGRGLSLQLKVTSVDGMPFDIMGWSSMESLNSGM